MIFALFGESEKIIILYLRKTEFLTLRDLKQEKVGFPYPCREIIAQKPISQSQNAITTGHFRSLLENLLKNFLKIHFFRKMFPRKRGTGEEIMRNRPNLKSALALRVSELETNIAPLLGGFAERIMKEHSGMVLSL